MDPRLTDILQSQGTVPQAPSFVGPTPEDSQGFAASTPGQAHQNVLRTALKLNDPESFGSKVAGILSLLSSNEAPGMPTMGILAGLKAAGAPTKTLQAAIKAEREGLPSQEIWRKYGWERGADKKWRWEIPDDAAKVRPGEGRLDELLTHPELFKAYPQLGRIPTKVAQGAYSGQYSREGENPLLEAAGVNPREMLQALMHESQHGVQDVERFAQGGSPEAMGAADIAAVRRAPTSPEDLRNLPNTAYKRLAGETEARNVEGRLGNPDLRRMAPSVTEDVPRLLQLVRSLQGNR